MTISQAGGRGETDPGAICNTISGLVRDIFRPATTPEDAFSDPQNPFSDLTQKNNKIARAYKGKNCTNFIA